MADKMVNYTPEMLRRLKGAYNTAVKAKAETFVFDGNEYLVSYAKYLIEFLETKFHQPIDPSDPQRN
jgi:hypothetical protein